MIFSFLLTSSLCYWIKNYEGALDKSAFQMHAMTPSGLQSEPKTWTAGVVWPSWQAEHQIFWVMTFRNIFNICCPLSLMLYFCEDMVPFSPVHYVSNSHNCGILQYLSWKLPFRPHTLASQMGKYILDYTITNVNPSNILLNKSPTQIYKSHQLT